MLVKLTLIRLPIFPICFLLIEPRLGEGIDPGMGRTPFPFLFSILNEIQFHNIGIMSRVRYPLDRTDAQNEFIVDWKNILLTLWITEDTL